MSAKHEARLAYYQGIKDAMLENVETAEKGLRAMEGISEAKIEKLVESLRKKHEKLMKQIDRRIGSEMKA